MRLFGMASDHEKMIDDNGLNLIDDQIINIGRHSIQIVRKIAEGGYSDIYEVLPGEKSKFTKKYALKRMYLSSNKKLRVM